MPHLMETEIKDAFLIAFNGILSCRDEIMAVYAEIVEALTNTASIDAEHEQLLSENEVMMGPIVKPAPTIHRRPWIRTNTNTNTLI
ncbi:MAG: hypothetical protein U0M15_10030 [Bacillota bacterium]|nr:hypothetical protein [Bacillota bacterium]